ncbi:hypothetical protein [Armatimonas sp.]|uniref:hypothetical protein n=1 Tax=Armatimonas sp. TaxID=1872638 RepID=UPI0037501B38
MKQLLLSFFALAATVPALAQDTVTTTVQGATRGSARAQSVTTNEPDWFSKTINIDFKNATLEEAIKKILEAAKVKFEKIDDQTKGNKSKLSLKMDDVNARDAMASISRLYGAQAFILNEDGKTTVELRKRTAEPTVRTLSGSLATPFPGFDATGFRPGSTYVLGTSERYKDLPTKKLDIEVKDGTALDIVKQICEKAGLEYELEEGIKSNVQVKITMKGISVGNALDNAAGWLDCGWKAEKKGDKIKISFSKKHPGPGFNFRISAPSVPFLGDLPVIGNRFRSAIFLSKRVSLDKKNTDVRECFKELLKDADLSYALADDLPTDAKSFTFSNVPLSTALDMICESIEVGWVAESGPDGKPVIRIGKRYKSRSRSTSNESVNLFRSTAPSLTRYNSQVDAYRGAARSLPQGSRRIPIDFL